jgi:hypothetical protein
MFADVPEVLTASIKATAQMQHFLSLTLFDVWKILKMVYFIPESIMLFYIMKENTADV